MESAGLPRHETNILWLLLFKSIGSKSYSPQPQLGNDNVDIEALLCTCNAMRFPSLRFTGNDAPVLRGQFADPFSLCTQRHVFVTELGSLLTRLAGRRDYRRMTTHIEWTHPDGGGRKEKVERWYRKQKIGQGAFGEVWLDVRREDDDVEKRAVKIIDKSCCRVDYKRELLALATFSQRQYQQEEVLVKFYGWFEDPSNLFLYMEYLELGDLEQHITESITEDDVKEITKDMLNGLRIIHSENFARRDLKPGNIFVVQKLPASNWRVKIGDFGISKRVQGNRTALGTEIGTLDYLVPEISGYLGTDELISVYDNAVDIWSLGCVIYKVATQRVPFPNRSDVRKFFDKTPSLFPEQPLLEKISMDGVEFVKSLIVPNPRERQSADSALKAPWLFPKETGMALCGKKLAAGVTYGQESLVEVADEVLNEKGDKETSLPQTSATAKCHKQLAGRQAGGVRILLPHSQASGLCDRSDSRYA